MGKLNFFSVVLLDALNKTSKPPCFPLVFCSRSKFTKIGFSQFKAKLKFLGYDIVRTGFVQLIVVMKDHVPLEILLFSWIFPRKFGNIQINFENHGIPLEFPLP